MQANSKRIRLSLDVTPAFFEMIENMAESNATSKSEILKKGIVLLDVALTEKAKGNHLGVLDSKQKLVSNIIGL